MTQFLASGDICRPNAKGWSKLTSERPFSLLGGFTVKETPSLRIPQRSCNRFEQTDRCCVYFRSKTRVRRNVGHDCKFTNDSIPHGLEIAWIFHEIRCSSMVSRIYGENGVYGVSWLCVFEYVFRYVND